MDYIFIYAKKDLIIEKNNEIKNPKENKELSTMKWRSEEDSINLFIY